VGMKKCGSVGRVEQRTDSKGNKVSRHRVG
jgi:hypothetical protein